MHTWTHHIFHIGDFFIAFWLRFIKADEGRKLVTAPMHYVWFSQFWSHFRGTMHCLPQRLKLTFFEIFSNDAAPKGPAKWRKFFQKTLILAFEVIVQPPKSIFSHFQKFKKHYGRKKWDQNHEKQLVPDRVLPRFNILLFPQ